MPPEAFFDRAWTSPRAACAPASAAGDRHGRRKPARRARRPPAFADSAGTRPGEPVLLRSPRVADRPTLLARVAEGHVERHQIRERPAGGGAIPRPRRRLDPLLQAAPRLRGSPEGARHLPRRVHVRGARYVEGPGEVQRVEHDVFDDVARHRSGAGAGRRRPRARHRPRRTRSASTRSAPESHRARCTPCR